MKRTRNVGGPFKKFASLGSYAWKTATDYGALATASGGSCLSIAVGVGEVIFWTTALIGATTVYRWYLFNASPKFLTETFGATLTYSHESNLLMVLRGRADIALMTRSNLIDMLGCDPQAKAQVMVSERIDQTYRHFALLRPQAPIQSQQFAQMLQKLRDNGQLKAIFAPYKIAVVEM